ncbi:HECT-like ubiquitin-conjugating enzyme-binding-domain-containing protein [Pisolithus orientalis]|uniref:HECT-like ubiquitin-conjugating enzyme-binding-domain-containing protein n=1 Tax=Pisolithus orientalis TaxID=936130 RepID=UPI0022242A68|nr:HECT-like ubiquitin-conjugating enzyme-binding-domain-containing protein [Pisolithus orientalis]KAI6019965.1 HECT-like ubiquitin-conjugating enzyme-binding-domain-containing protein [Pisolithus orientalis]
MATLARTAVSKGLDQDDATRSLRYSVPSPFPTERLIDLEGSSDDEILNELAAERVEYDVPEIASERPLKDIQLSIAAVQESCLTTLANLLSVSISVQPPIAHEHSVSLRSSQGLLVPAIAAVETQSNTSALGALVHALRVLDGIVDYGGSHPLAEGGSRDIVREATLLMQLRDLVDAHVPSMHRHDAHLAQAIVGLLTDLHQLSTSFVSTPELSLSLSSGQPTSQSSPQLPSTPATENDPHTVLTTLQRQLSSLQPSNSVDASTSTATPTAAPAQHLQAALLWARIDEQLATVVALCKTRGLANSDLQIPDNTDPFSDAAAISGGVEPTESNVDAPSVPSFDEDHLPPQYEYEYDVVHGELPPAYATDLAIACGSLGDQKQMSEYPPEKASGEFSALSQRVSHAHQSTSVDLDLVTGAIDRLYAAAPQLTNQRVELRQKKIAQMKKAQRTNNKGKAREVTSVQDPELDKMLDLLGRASSREIPDQSVVIDPTRKPRVKKKQDLKEQRYTYIEHIVQRSTAGRLHSQDATSSSIPSLTVNPRSQNSPVTENEQIRSNHSLREGGGAEVSKGALAAPEMKNRSMSWDRSYTASSTQDSHSHGSKNSSSSVRRFSERFGSKSRPTSSGGPTISGALDVVYIAEHHETLKHVLVFVSLPRSFSSNGNFNLNGQSSSSGTLTAEVLADMIGQTRGDQLLLRLSGTPSLPLGLPVSVTPGLKNALAKGTHWEIKLSCAQRTQSLSTRNSMNVTPSENDDSPLLSASQLTTLLPISYTCVSCLLPLVTPAPTQYRDLPSEYWEELVDAWMCHPEGQTLADLKVNMRGGAGKSGQSFGFWPAEGEALVGGSYILFEGRAVVGGNVREVITSRGDSACLIRCLCGAIVGRRQEHKLENGSTLRMYRLSKYAIRLISPAAECPKIPMSAFIVRDMIEHVQAHATYRFVLSDEEEEKPRILVWLFKPRIRISYMLSSPLFLPRNDSIEASKVLYKILGPDSTTDIKELLNKYPGFPQAEHLFYPMDVCRKLAALLSESTRAYPESLRTMTGLEVGWLHRG